jgi:hypothetical protein
MPIADRLWSQVAVGDPDECWPWIGKAEKAGYGAIRLDQSLLLRAHRVAYESEVGPIPEGHHLHHVCENPSCCNPAHLEPLTPQGHTIAHAALRAALMEVSA